MTLAGDIGGIRTGPEISARARRHAPLVAFIIAWATLFAPVYLDFAAGAWRRPENAHAPFIIAIVIASVWVALEKPIAGAPGARARAAGIIILIASLLVFPVARTGDVDLVTSGLQATIATGAVLSVYGLAGVRRLWFSLLMLLYLIVWPGWLLDAATLPLKMALSGLVADVLYAAGLPVSHAGALLYAGPYQLLVADACSGLNSLIALTSVGAVYLRIVNRASTAAALIVVAGLIPIAVIANAIRIMVLVLITYYLGYDAGQGFLHETAGLILFVTALLGVFVVDAVARRLFPRAAAASPRADADVSAHALSGRRRASFAASALMAVAGGVAMAMTLTAAPAQRPETIAAPDFEAAFPAAFGVWRRTSIDAAVLPPESTLGPGEAVAYGAYRDDLGRIVTVVLAYGPPLGDSVRLHRPETCYVAQGFSIDARYTNEMETEGRVIDIVRMATHRADTREAVSYWLREGDAFVTAAPQSGLRALFGGGGARDGALVRVSTRHGLEPDFALHTTFMSGFLSALPPKERRLLAGPDVPSGLAHGAGRP